MRDIGDRQLSSGFHAISPTLIRPSPQQLQENWPALLRASDVDKLKRAPLPNLLIHMHGAAFTSWMLLLITQISLVSASRVDIHQKLGIAGFSLACLMVVLGTLAATNMLARDEPPFADA